MYLQSLLVIFCLLICSYFQGTDETTQLPEDDPKNFPEQNAKELVELGGRHWVKSRTYEVKTKKGEPTCEYAEIYGQATTEVGYTLELGAKLGSTWTSKNQTLLLEMTAPHTEPNVLKFTRLSADGPLGHPLLYSDYEKCHIVRIKKKNSQDYRCDLLLTNEAAKQSPPAACETKFKEYCKGPRYEVYKSNCDETGPKTS
uniref:Putative salivary lipocalin n=1 Tax=Ixodes ricinus TaxID=34613 RepID=A0A0K8R8G9_IXORI